MSGAPCGPLDDQPVLMLSSTALPSMEVKAAYAMAISNVCIACACANGTVRLRATKSLASLGDLPRPSEREHAFTALLARGVMPQDPRFYPDAVACSFDGCGERLVVVYDDRQVLFWNVKDFSRVRVHKHASHAHTPQKHVMGSIHSVAH